MPNGILVLENIQSQKNLVVFKIHGRYYISYYALCHGYYNNNEIVSLFLGVTDSVGKEENSNH